MSLAQDIAVAARGWSFAQATEQQQSKLKLCLIANLSAAVAGGPFTKVGARPPESGAGKGHLLLTGGQTDDAERAVFWNSAAMHSRMQDDMNAKCNLHAGIAILPSCIAAAEERIRAGNELSGLAILTAMASAYGVTCGLARESNKATTKKGWRSTSLYGVFGSAIGAGLILELEADALAHAIALSASLAGGLTQCWLDGGDEWQLQPAVSARNGWLAAQLAQHHRVVGARHALEGASGFYSAIGGTPLTEHSLDEQVSPGRAIDETLVKRYPMSGIVQPVALVAERLATRSALDIGSIASVEIKLNSFEAKYPGTCYEGPFESFSSRLMSAQFACAAVLLSGGFRFQDLADGANQKRDELIGKTTVTAVDDLPSLSCQLLIRFKDGSTIEDSYLSNDMHAAPLGIEGDSIAKWATALWIEAGRTAAQYSAFEEIVMNLETRGAAELLRALGDVTS